MSSWGRVRPPVGAQILREHPLAQGLAGVWLLDRAIFDLTGRNPQLGVTSSVGWNPDGMFCTATSGYGLLKPTKLIGGEEFFTVMAWAKITGTDANTRDAYCERGSSGNDIIRLGQRGSSNTTAEFTWRNDAGTLKQIFGTKTINDGLVHQLVARQRSTTDMHLFVDGIQDGSNTPGALNFTDATVETRVGGDKGDTTAGWTAGAIRQIYVWRRGLTDAEIRALAVRPYAFIAPPTFSRIRVDVPVAPPDTSKMFAVF